MDAKTKEAVAHWRMLAKQERERLNWDKYAHPSVVNAKAETYENAAKSLELGDKHGEPYCACHLIPMRACAERARTERARKR